MGPFSFVENNIRLHRYCPKFCSVFESFPSFTNGTEEFGILQTKSSTMIIYERDILYRLL